MNDLIRSFIDRTLKSDGEAAADFTKFVQQKAQQFIKAQSGATQTPTEPVQTPPQTEPTA